MAGQDFEKLGAFFLGKVFDRQAGAATDELLLYESKDLTTHAVCVGMTGSGKTGLCISLLEEAALDNIPALIIDPKGDMGNLLLTFPDLKPESFRPWLDEGEAARKGLTLDEHAQKTADTWKRGLQDWGQGPERIRALRQAADIAIYTPGSTAGIPLSVLKSFSAPADAPAQSADAMRDRIQATTSGLLAMLGLNTDPLQSREHILLSNILSHAWKEGRSPDLPALLHAIQSPPFDKLGVFDMETFYPSADRFTLAMRLNNMLAAPGFEVWMKGEPLNIQNLLWTADGRPRLSILSIAHLSDAERMFFVTILLNEVVAWMRSQPGTSSLRAILYMDEIFGYFPPTANPPSKQPMLTLLKQARAYGLGCVLATQNPVDLDYKGLSNTGTWFIGRLQTDRDKMRVLDGLEGASGSTGKGFDRAAMEATLAGLGNRVFLMNNVHDDEPVLFSTRWAMSFLRGPLTRMQIEALTSRRPAIETPPPAAAVAPVTPPSALGRAAALPATPAGEQTPDANKPAVPPDIQQQVLAVQSEVSAQARLVYRPVLLADSKLHFVKSTASVDDWQTLYVMATIPEEKGPVAWGEATRFGEKPVTARGPEAGAVFAELPAPASVPRNYAAWQGHLKDFLYQNQTLTLWRCPALKLTTEVGESLADFKARIVQLSRETRDLDVEKLKQKYAARVSAAREHIRKAEMNIEKEQEQYKQQKMHTAISFGTTLLGAFLGRRTVSVGTVGKAGTAVRGIGRAAKEKEDIGRAREDLAAQQQKLAALESQFDEDSRALTEKYDQVNLELEEIVVRPRKSDIIVGSIRLAWTPWAIDKSGIAERAF